MKAVVQRAGIVQFFEICFELSWNVLKDYLEAQGFAGINSPRAGIKKAFEIGSIHDGNLAWSTGCVPRKWRSRDDRKVASGRGSGGGTPLGVYPLRCARFRRPRRPGPPSLALHPGRGKCLAWMLYPKTF